MKTPWGWLKERLAPPRTTIGTPGHAALPTMEESLRRCAGRGIRVNSIIDVGASNGMWSELAYKHFPQSAYLLIEAQTPHEEALKKFKRNHPSSDYVMAAAGDVNGTINFHGGDLFGGCAAHHTFASNCIVVPCVTVDSQVAARGLKGPFLIKFDTHGFETSILKGAAETLKETEVIVMETYAFKLGPTALLFHEMCDHLGSLGFRCIDICDLLHRPKDNALWQMDMIFARSDSAEFASNTY